jgi:hypothetical protein
MTRTANRFTDPPTGLVYDWPLNHQAEEEAAPMRSVTHTATTSGSGLVWQQGEDEPIVFTFTGTVLDPAQHEAFTGFSRACKDHTIIFRDFAGEEYEVLMSYKPRREGVVRNFRGGTVAPYHIWRYTMTLQVIQVISGNWHD